jgi:hypothetical protein
LAKAQHRRRWKIGSVLQLRYLGEPVTHSRMAAIGIITPALSTGGFLAIGVWPQQAGQFFVLLPQQPLIAGYVVLLMVNGTTLAPTTS